MFAGGKASYVIHAQHSVVKDFSLTCGLYWEKEKYGLIEHKRRDVCLSKYERNKTNTKF